MDAQHVEAAVLDHARAIGALLEGEYPAVVDPHPGISVDSADRIADAITLVVAEILQAWLDAGSERDVTLEDLTPAISAHVNSWAL